MNAPGPTVPPPSPPDLASSLRRNIHALQERRREEAAHATRQEKLAQAITAFTGSMAFVYIHLVAYTAWVVVNVGLIPGVKPFDPSLVILATEASVEAIFLSTFVLISQNRSAAASDKRADLDLHISLLTEHELTKLVDIVTTMAAKLDVPLPGRAEIEEIRKDVAPEAVLDEIEATEQEAPA